MNFKDKGGYYLVCPRKKVWTSYSGLHWPKQNTRLKLLYYYAEDENRNILWQKVVVEGSQRYLTSVYFQFTLFTPLISSNRKAYAITLVLHIYIYIYSYSNMFSLTNWI